MGGPGLGRTADNPLLVFLRLTMIRDQGQVTRNVEIALALPDAWMKLPTKDAVQSVLQTGRSGKALTRTSRKRLPDGAFCNSRQADSMLRRCTLAYANTYRISSAVIRVLRKSSGKFLRTTSTKAFNTCSERIVRVILRLSLDIGTKLTAFRPFRELLKMAFLL